MRYVDPQRLVTSYTSSPDFRDIVHAGEIVRMNIRDLKKIAGDQFDDEEYEEMAKLVSMKYGNNDRHMIQMVMDMVDILTMITLLKLWMLSF